MICTCSAVEHCTSAGSEEEGPARIGEVAEVSCSWFSQNLGGGTGGGEGGSFLGKSCTEIFLSLPVHEDADDDDDDDELDRAVGVFCSGGGGGGRDGAGNFIITSGELDFKLKGVELHGGGDGD